MKQDIVNRNPKGQLEGYQERYSDVECSIAFFRGYFMRGTFDGYCELYLTEPYGSVTYYI